MGFCGLKDNLSYASGSVYYFDNTNTFSVLWIRDFITLGG
jgi:hypothetical protein